MLVVPAIDLRSGKCVRWVKGDPRREVPFGDDPVEWALRWRDQGAKLLHVVDLEGALAGRPCNLKVFERIVRESGIPAQLGGGLRRPEDLRAAFAAGASRVVVSTKALEDGGFLRLAVDEHGPERVVVSLDVGKAGLVVSGWTRSARSNLPAARMNSERPGVLGPVIEALSANGVRRVVVTEVDLDGTMGGPKLDAAVEVAGAGLRVLVAGGIGTLDHLRKISELGAEGIEGAIVGMALYEGRFRLDEALAL